MNWKDYYLIILWIVLIPVSLSGFILLNEDTFTKNFVSIYSFFYLFYLLAYIIFIIILLSDLLKKGSSTLEIYPPKFESRIQKKEDAVIEIDNEEKPSSIVRKLISLYFLGFKTINVKPKNGRLSPNQRNTVKEAVKRMLMGSEIISDSSGGITVQVLVNLLELSVDGAFKRMIHLAKSM